MNAKSLIICCFAVLVFQLTATAQSSSENALFYNSIGTPQANTLNPALFPDGKNVFITLPNAGLQINSPSGMSGIFNKDKQTDGIFNYDSIFSTIVNINAVDFDASFNILGAGVKFGRTHVTLSSQLHLSTHIGMGNGFVQSIKNSGRATEQILPLADGEIINHQSYAEIGLGIGHHFPLIRLTVAGRVKLLYGLSFISSTNSEFDISRTSDNISATLNYNVVMASAAAFNFSNFNQFDFNASQLFTTNNGNYGLAFDLGAAFEIGPLSISASVLNIGKGIHWQEQFYSVTDNAGQSDLSITGFDFSTTANSLNAESIQHIKDQNDKLQFTPIEGGDFYSKIPTKVNIGASVDFLNICSFGIFANGQWDNYKSISEVSPHKLFRYNTTATLGVNISNWVELMGCAAIVSDATKTSFFNPGVGIILSPFSVTQIYFLANYTSDIYFADAQKAKFNFGINIVL